MILHFWSIYKLMRGDYWYTVLYLHYLLYFDVTYERYNIVILLL